MSVMVAPIPTDKVEAWRAWSKELGTTRANELKELNQRYGLKRHTAWFTETPAGPAAVVLHEGPGAETFIQKLAQSTNEFDVWFRSKVQELHNMDLTQPPPGPPAEKLIDSTD